MSNLSDYTTFDFPSSSGQTIAVSPFVDGQYTFTDVNSHLAGTTNVTLTGMASGYNRTIINSTAHMLIILPGSIAVPISNCALLSYNGTNWSQLVAFSGVGTAAGGDLGGTYPNPSVVSLTGGAGVVNIGPTGNVFTWNTATTNPGLSQIIAGPSSTPQNIIISPQAPNASASTTTTKTPGSAIISLAQPISGGSMPSLTVNIDGYTSVQIGATSVDTAYGAIWMGLQGVTPNSNNAAIAAIAGTLQISSPVNNGQITINGGSTGYFEILGQTSTFGFTGIYSQISAYGFVPTVINPRLFHATRNSDAATTNLIIQAQSALPGAITNVNAGTLVLQGGAAESNGTTGLRGGVRLQVGADTSETLVEVTEVVLGQRIVALTQLGSGITSTQMAASTGDGVIYVGNANVNPSASPVGGAILYASGGTLNVYQSNGTSFQIQAGGSSFTAGGDLSGSNTNQTVIGIQSHPVLSQTLGSAQDGYVLTWRNSASQWQALTPTGGSGGSFSAGGDLTGTSLSQQVISMTGLGGFLDIASTGAIILWAKGTSNPGISQTTQTSGNGTNMSIAAQSSSAASSLGGDLILASGVGTSSDGYLALSTGQSERLIVNPNGVIQITNLSTGILHSDASGNLTSSTIVNADISAAAAIAVSKLAAGTSAQILINNATPSPIWASISGDSTITNTGAMANVALTGSAGSVSIASTGNILTWVTATTAPGIKQTDNTTNSATAATMTVQAQNATGTAATGGGLTLTSGTGTTAAGAVILATGGTTRLTANASGVVTVANLGLGVVHADASGNLTSSTLVNADVAAGAAIVYSKLSLGTSILNSDISTTAAIAVSKLAAGTSAQVLLNSGTPTPTWTSLSGDMTVGNTGTTTVAKINGITISGTPSIGYVPTATSSSAATWQVASGSSVYYGNLYASSTFTSTGASYVIVNAAAGYSWTAGLSSGTTLDATTNGSITVTHAGTYQVSLNGVWYTTGSSYDNYSWAIYQNGVAIASATQSYGALIPPFSTSGAPIGLSISTIVTASASDVFQIALDENSNSQSMYLSCNFSASTI